MKPLITAELQIVALGTDNTSMSKHVSDAVSAIEKLGIKYQLTPMGTGIETDSLEGVFDAVKAAHNALEKNGVKRILTHVTIDDRKDRPKGLSQKIESVKSKI